MKTSHGQDCKNHPDLKVLGSCRICHEWLCHKCLQEGPRHYYCHKPKCRKAYQSERKYKKLHDVVLCPSCRKPIKGDPRFCDSCAYRLKPIAPDEADDLVTIARYGTPLEAHLARTKLESRNIESYVADEHMISLFPTRDIGWGGVKLKVKRSEMTKALRIFNNPKEGSFWVPHPMASAVYLFPLIVGIPLLIVLTPIVLLLALICKKFILNYIAGFFRYGRYGNS